MKLLLSFVILLSFLSCGDTPQKTIYIFDNNIDSIAWGVLPEYAYSGGLREKSSNTFLREENLDTSMVRNLKSHFIQTKIFTGNEAMRIHECFRFHLAEGTDEVERNQQKRLPPEYRDILIFYKENKIAGWARISFATEETQFKSYTNDYESEMGAYTYKIGVDYISLKEIIQK